MLVCCWRGNGWDAGVGPHCHLIVVGLFSVNGGHGRLLGSLLWVHCGCLLFWVLVIVGACYCGCLLLSGAYHTNDKTMA